MDTAIKLVYVTVPFISLSVNVAVQVLAFRYFSKKGLLRSVYCGFFAGFCFMVILDALYFKYAAFLFKSMTPSVIANIIIYAASGYCFFNFICLGETARRIRMLIEIYDSGDGLSLEALLGRYNAAEIVKRRMGRLLDNGQLVRRDGKYFIGKPAVMLISRFFILLKLVLLGRKAESGTA